MAETGSKAGTGLTIITLLALLAACTAVAVYLWTSLEDVAMSGHGWAAMILGVVISFALGVGLMMLVFISNRRGYDDDVS
ncbi:MAG: hypothetical protein ACR2PM_21060 [Hyphomicrobiales bacterium]